MKSQTTTQTTQAAEAKTKELSDGARIGRALTKLMAFNESERVELETTPATVREKWSAKRQAYLDGLEPHIREAALAAIVRLSPASAAE
jgi:hypothetical protein